MGKCSWSKDGFCQLFAIRYGNIHPACDGQVLPGQKNACRQGKLDLVKVGKDPFDQLQDPGDPPDPQRKNHPGRGGRRAGAGAPAGNLNAIKSGAYSRQLKDSMIHQKQILSKARQARDRRAAHQPPVSE